MFACDGKLGEERLVMPTAQLNAASLLKLLEGREIKRVLAASVVPRAAAEIYSAFGDKVTFVSGDNISTFELDYPGVVTLGADRIANVAGLVQMGRVPGIAVDLGTATTFDVVVPGRRLARFVGGAIAPGLAAMGQYLAGGTAQLPKVDIAAAPRAIGSNTVEAIQSGCLYGYCGLVRGVLESIEQELGFKPYIVATGGDAPLIASYLPEIDAVDPLLTFRGLHALSLSLF